MKTYKISYLLIISVVIFFASCKDLLEVDTTNTINTDDGVITNIDRANVALIGMYSGMQGANYLGTYSVIWNDLAADNLEHTGTQTVNADIYHNEILTSNTRLLGIWQQMYYVINIANTIITDVEAMNVAADKKNPILGEAYFVRAYTYHCLNKYWNGVPLQLTPVRKLASEIKKLPRNTKDQVDQQIFNDLDDAISLLDGYDPENGHANVWAAKALKARVHLYRGEWQNAYDAADDIIEHGPYQLAEKYSQIFDYRVPYSRESIFELDFDDQDGNSYAFWFFERAFGGRREFAPTESLIDAYAYNATTNPDTRFENNVYYYADEDRYMVTKYNDVSTGSDNIVVTRLAEMYLIRAEAKFKGATGTAVALDDVNAIRDRAGIDPLVGPLTIDDILKERRLEFAFEGLRFDDFQRYELLSEKAALTNANQLRWPIPQLEVDVVGLLQNPGY